MSIHDRKYTRIILPKNQRVELQLRLEDGRNTIFDATVLNFSEGGFGLTASRANGMALNKSDQLTVVSASNTGVLGDLCAIQMEIMWILDDARLSHLGFGCMFTQLSMNTQEHLRSIVGTWGDDLL